MNKKKCPRCKMSKTKGEWADGGWTNVTYCKKCQKYYNKIKRNKNSTRRNFKNNG